MSKISEILKRLMAEKELRTAELARQVNLPQPTVHRIVTGVSPNPHMGSLVPIAEFFNLTVEQLRGLHPIPNFDNIGSPMQRVTGWRQLPVITLAQAYHWPPESEEERHKMLLQLSTYTDAKVAQASFATTVNDASMEPYFPEGSLLVIDCESKPNDRDFVLAKLEGASEAVCRQILVNGGDTYLRPLSPELQALPMTKATDDMLIGRIAQSRHNFR